MSVVAETLALMRAFGVLCIAVKMEMNKRCVAECRNYGEARN